MKPEQQTNERSRFGQRRRRTFFTNKQLKRFEEVFEEDKFPGIEIRERLANEFGIREDRIQVWFQNRRARWRRHEIKNKPAPSGDSDTTDDDFRPAFPPCFYPLNITPLAFHPEFVNRYSPAFVDVTPTAVPSCQTTNYTIDEYAAAFGLLSVYNRQD